MIEQFFTSGKKMGTMGGLLTIFFANIMSSDILKTAILSATGAVVSFGMSLLLKMILRKRKH